MVDHLLPRQRECLELATAGLTNAEIADRLCVGVETVKTHLHRAYDRLGVQDAGNPRVVAAIIFDRQARGED